MKTITLAVLLAVGAPLQSHSLQNDAVPYQSPWLVASKMAAHEPVREIGWLERVNMSAHPAEIDFPIPDLSLGLSGEDFLKWSASLSSN